MKTIIVFSLYLLSFSTAFSQNLIKDCANPNYARVVFFRTPHYYGDGVFYKLYLNDSVLTEVKRSHFSVIDFTPGTTKILANRNDYKNHNN